MDKSLVFFEEHLPALNPTADLIVYDQILLQHKFFQQWLSFYPYQRAFVAGEMLKELDAFPQLCRQVLSAFADMAPVVGEHRMVIVGGGSLGDSLGLICALYRRGRPLVMIPSTWVAAIDSAHGGKTALNVDTVKNQFGSFYPAQQIFLVKDLLTQLPEQLCREGLGELIKMAILAGGDFFAQIEKHARIAIGSDAPIDLRMANNFLWEMAALAVEFKWQVVAEDPYEKNGGRAQLNLGHTVGHVLEAYYGLAHGVAVGYGLLFAINFSQELGLMDAGCAENLRAILMAFGLGENKLNLFSKMERVTFLKLLKHDKKSAANASVGFVFPVFPGRWILRKISYDQIAAEANRQEWLKTDSN